jgi:hypothetical protein
MNCAVNKIFAIAALVGALALPLAAPTQAADGRNAAFAAGVAAGVVGGALLAPRPAYPAYGYPAYGPGPGYYAAPRVVRPYPYRRRYNGYYR